MDVDTFELEYKVPGKGKAKVYEVDYESLSQRDVENMMRQDVENISGICGVDVSIWLIIFYCKDQAHVLICTSV